MMMRMQSAHYFAQAKGTVKRVRLGRTGTSLKLGLLGMANIGKSSTFNLLSNLNVPAENIPFCTIDPNTAFISVKDPRFEGLCQLYKPQKEVGPVLRVVDIAGLVKGASQGFGLGNEFLSNLMQVDALYHVVRAFEKEEVAHTEGGMDPVRDIKIIRHELIQKDLSMMEKKIEETSRKAKKTQDRQLKMQYEVMLKVRQNLEGAIEIRNLNWSNDEIEILNKFTLLTSKPMIYLLNLSKHTYSSDVVPGLHAIERVITEDGKFPARYIKYSVEHEEQRQAHQPSQIQQIMQAGYEELELIHFYTVGPDEVRAWPIRKGENAQEAGGKIHTDFMKAFINAEVIESQKLLKNPEYVQKLQKYCRKEGKAYVVKDGDIVHFNCKKK